MDQLGDVTRQLLLLMKNRDITALSIASPAIAERMDKLRYDSDFYHELTERQFNKELDRRDGADWYTIYHNLTIVDYGKRIAAVSSDLDSLAVQAELSGEDDPFEMLLYYREVRSAKIFRWMLESDVDEASVRSVIVDTLWENAEEGEKMLEMILLPPYKKKYKFTIYRALQEAVGAGNLEATLRINKDDPRLLRDPYLLPTAVDSNNPALVRLIAVGKTQGVMEDAIRSAINHKKDKSLQVLLSMASKEVMNQVTNRFLESVQVRGLLDRTELTWMLENGMRLSLGDWDRLANILYLRSPNEKNLDILALKQKYSAVTRTEIDEQLYLSGGELDTYWKLAQFLLTSSQREGLKPFSMLVALSRQTSQSVVEKSRTAEDILIYLRDELFTDEVKIAVRSIFNPTLKLVGRSSEYRALILYLLYPNMSMEESTKYLREVDKYSDNQVLMSNLLIKLVPR